MSILLAKYFNPIVTSVFPNNGGPGTSIAITGKHFSTSATVTVGGNPCTSVVRVSLTSITCVTPTASIGAQDVIVTNNYPTPLASAAAIFTYQDAVYRAISSDGNITSSSPTITIMPDVGDLFLVYCNANGNTNVTPTCSDDNGGTYTLIGTALLGVSSSMLSVFARTTALPNATATIVTVACGASLSVVACVVAISGMPDFGVGAIRGSAFLPNQIFGTPSHTFGAATLSTNLTLAVLATQNDPPGITPPTGWTEQLNIGFTDGGFNSAGLTVSTRYSGFAGTTITWGSSTASNWACVLLELVA